MAVSVCLCESMCRNGEMAQWLGLTALLKDPGSIPSMAAYRFLFLQGFDTLRYKCRQNSNAHKAKIKINKSFFKRINCICTEHAETLFSCYFPNNSSICILLKDVYR